MKLFSRIDKSSRICKGVNPDIAMRMSHPSTRPAQMLTEKLSMQSMTATMMVRDLMLPLKR